MGYNTKITDSFPASNFIWNIEKAYLVIMTCISQLVTVNEL